MKKKKFTKKQLDNLLRKYGYLVLSEKDAWHIAQKRDRMTKKIEMIWGKIPPHDTKARGEMLEIIKEAVKLKEEVNHILRLREASKQHLKN